MVAAFAGIAFAAQPTSQRADVGAQSVQESGPWAPGKNMVMWAHEPGVPPLPPPPR